MVHQTVQLEEIHIVHPQPLQRTVKLVSGSLIGPLARLRGQKEVLAMVSHPRANAQLRIPVGVCGVNVVDPVPQQHLQSAIGLGLGGPSQCPSSEDGACAHMARAAKGLCLDHPSISLSGYSSRVGTGAHPYRPFWSVVGALPRVRTGAVRDLAGR